VFELRCEVHLFFKNMNPLSSHFEDEAWVCRLAYLADIFSKLNDLYLNLQCNGNTYSQWKINCAPLYESACVARTNEIRKFGSISYSAGFP
jgi:hypothetical protein